MKIRILAILSLLFFQALTTRAAEFDPLAELDHYNVAWDSPSSNAAGSMPIGNGEVGLNVWVEGDGDLLFYISRTDAWSECCRLLKLGRIRVSLSPNPFTKGAAFRQELKLRDGQIEITAGDASLHIFVDADAPVIHITGSGKTPRTVTATLEDWRTDRHVLTGGELASSWTMHSAPASVEVAESADHFSHTRDAITWFHRNASSVVPLTLKLQGLETAANLVHDPLLNRTFGARITGDGFISVGDRSLKSTAAVTDFSLAIATLSAQTRDVDEWQRDLAQPASPEVAERRTAAWWHEFWNRSWIIVDGDQADEVHTRRRSRQGVSKPLDEETLVRSPVTQAYVLQRWITACAGRGHYPIKFNGSIFTVDPKFAGGHDYNPDWRRWGDCYWWQNTRFPYFPMLARGDYEEVRPLFDFYRNALPLCRARAKIYHGVEGAYFPETMTIFGTYSNGDYGWNRNGHQSNEVLNPWWRYAWQQGLELTALMIDYYDHTQDEKFLHEELIPMAHEVLSYYDTRFKRDVGGKLVISPTQAVETYWSGVVNDTPSVAGLHDVLDRLLTIQAPPSERAFWQRMKDATPPIAVRDGRVAPAEAFEPKRSNAENPELYAIWPFHLFGVGLPAIDIGQETFKHRIEKASIGWQYDGQCAAIVGLTDDARRILLGKVRKSNRKFRFPAMWGPNYDWLPDQDHGSNIMLTLQEMMLQTVGDKILLLPAWPKDWNVAFKLHAPKNTVVEGVYRGGKVEQMKVTPESRRKDVQIMLGRN